MLDSDIAEAVDTVQGREVEFVRCGGGGGLSEKVACGWCGSNNMKQRWPSLLLEPSGVSDELKSEQRMTLSYVDKATIMVSFSSLRTIEGNISSWCAC